MSLQALISETRKLLSISNTKDALKLVKAQKSKYSNNVEFLQLIGEVYLENGKVEKAYEYLEKACELDINGEYGSDKFFYLGQIIGGLKGLEFIDHGISQLTSLFETNSTDLTIIKKLNQGIFSEIEIWMTDLCMEPEAESKCDELINQSLTIDDQNPESWSLLASIRISQQRDDEAKKAIEKSWELFEKRKTKIEDIASGVITEEDDSIDISTGYVELIQPLLTLSRYSIELGDYELGSIIASNIRDIDEDNVESYYLEGFANYLYIKKSLYDKEYKEFKPEIFENFIIKDFEKDYQENKINAQKNLSYVLKFNENGLIDGIDSEIIEHSTKLLNELGGPIEINVDENVEINEDNWADKIVSDDE